MDQELINAVMHDMSKHLNNEQMMLLKESLEKATAEDNSGIDLRELLERFLSTKRLEGRSERTIKYYRTSISKMLEAVGKSVMAITTDDLRAYLADYQSRPTVSKATVDN